MRKPAFCIYAKTKMQISDLAIFFSCTARFESELVGNPEHCVSHEVVHMVTICLQKYNPNAVGGLQSLQQGAG